jgi:hypothetical protein
MTTQTLVERLRLGASISRERGLNLDFADVADQAAAALEAQAAEIGRLREVWLDAGWSSCADALIKTIEACDELRAELAALKAQPVVAWIEHDWSGAGARPLCFERRAPSVRDQVVNPIWTPLCVSAQAQAQPSPVAQEVGLEPVIDFTILHQFASDQAISYNKLRTAVLMSLTQQKGEQP